MLLTKHHKEELPDLIKLSQIALTLPLHTASCERVFSQQRLILTKQRSRIAPATSDKLLRTRLASNAGVILNFEDSPTLALAKKEANKNKIGKVKEYTKIMLILFSAYTGLLILTHGWPIHFIPWPIDLCQHGAIGPLTFFSS